MDRHEQTVNRQLLFEDFSFHSDESEDPEKEQERKRKNERILAMAEES